MIARLWHGWTTPQNADTYQNLLKDKILPEIHRVAGYKGAYVLRREAGHEVEFITLTMFESMDAVRSFAGKDHEKAVVLPEAEKLLAHFDGRSAHYEVVLKQD
ncbi:MAG TPA: antibiotic biosynthesis monooxygenase [Terriglobales bacterium]|jgi:heme-degrading monooxygenase HmoA